MTNEAYKNLIEVSEYECDKYSKKENNIDEDIKRCKELIKDKNKEWIGLTNQKAIANVLEAYEKLKNKKV